MSETLTPAQRVEAILREAVGRTCVRCGEVFTGTRCKACNRKRALARYYANHERELARANTYAREHKEERRIYRAKHYIENREKELATAKQWALKNRERVVAYRVSHRQANRSRLIEQSRLYRQQNPNAKRRSEAKRRALQKLCAARNVPANIVADLFIKQRGKCPCCRLPLGDDYELDHIVPLAKGGEHAANNLQLLRKLCNRQKSAKHPIDYMQQKGYLV